MTAGTTLTQRELEVAALVAEGLTNKEIAARLFLSERTAEGHVEHIRDKLGFGTRSQIATWYTQTRVRSAEPGAAAPAAMSVAAPSPITSARRAPVRRLALLGVPVVIAIAVAAAVILARPSGPTLILVAELGIDGFSGDGGPATVAQLGAVTSMFFGPDGALVVADSHASLSPQGQFIDRTDIRQVDRNGTITTIAGNGSLNFDTSANGGSLWLHALASVAPGPAGAIYLASGSVVPIGGGGTQVTSGNWIGRIDRDGAFHVLA